MEKRGKMKRQIILPQVCAFKGIELAFMVLPSKRKCKWLKNEELLREVRVVVAQSPAHSQPPLHSQEDNSTETVNHSRSLSDVLSHGSTDYIKIGLYFNC